MQKGFTLIELMIVVAIVGLLAGIAYPAYTQSVEKSRRSDAMIALQELFAAQERRFNIYNKYTSNLTLVGGNASSEGHYALTIALLNGSPSHCDSSEGNCFRATATAVGPQLGDEDCRSFTLTSFGQKKSFNNSGAETDCW